MNDDTVIKVEKVSKQYRLGLVGTGTLSHDLNRLWARIRRREDPYLNVGDVNDRTKKSESGLVWALRNINFEVRRGEVLGVIGRNGAGKSTLLKILTRITSPTTGQIEMRGRIGALLEVGTGFHPELTGRENIYLNGAILGMRAREIKRKLDEIVAFSGVEKYLDTPIKRYSSGMKVRLGFSVAVHLEPEILIIDEVLAVGDIEFQQKCMSKIGEISSGQKGTVLLVSHNMSAIRNVCQRVLLMKNGEIEFLGATEDGLEALFKSTVNVGPRYENDMVGPTKSGVKCMEVHNTPLVGGVSIETRERIQLRVRIGLYEAQNDDLLLTIGVRDSLNNLIFITNNEANRQPPLREFARGDVEYLIGIPGNIFKEGTYKFIANLRRKTKGSIDKYEMVLNLVNSDFIDDPLSRQAIISPKVEWAQTAP